MKPAQSSPLGTERHGELSNQILKDTHGKPPQSPSDHSILIQTKVIALARVPQFGARDEKTYRETPPKPEPLTE
jgi:hypothetical protein